MGAEVIIGSNVSAGAYTDANLRSPVDVLLQISSFKVQRRLHYPKAAVHSLCQLSVGRLQQRQLFGIGAHYCPGPKTRPRDISAPESPERLARRFIWPGARHATGPAPRLGVYC